MPHPSGNQVARKPFPLQALLTVAICAVSPAWGQYPGHTQKADAKKPAEPRAVSILEWVGDPGKPVASRIVPLSVFVDGEYQDGGLYLAKPAPLTVDTDTLYDLEQAGVPKGTFYVAGGENVGGSWFGYGQWKPLAAPKPVKKLPPSKIPPKVVQDSDPDRPHFKGGEPASTTSGNGQSSGSNTPAPPPADPDKPTLHRHASTDDGGQTASGAGTAPDDPDRPHLKKRSAADAGAAGGDEGAPVTSANEPDPDRPKLGRGKPREAQTQLEATRLTGMPPDLQQMAAVSDAANREEHVFSYPWPDPNEATRMQAAVEALAVQTVLSGGAAPATPVSAVSTPGPTSRVAGPRNTLAHKVARKPIPVELSEKDFHAYELSYSGGATLVFSAKALIGPDAAGQTMEKYVTIIAQPDFNGDPQLRLQSVTDAKHLDITPRMRLVDAVDTDGDNRAELVFELQRSSDRQFAIYKVLGNHAEQAFATESLPYVTPSHIPGTSPN